MIYYYITLFAVSLLATWWIFKKVLRIALSKNIVDNPDARKLQRTPVAVLGGMTVFFGMVVAFAFSSLTVDTNTLFPVLIIMTLLLFVGTMDDILSLSPSVRFLIEIAAMLLLIYGSGFSINDFHGLWGLNSIPGYVAVPLTVFACVGIINAINLIDGVNGLSSGYCICACIIFAAAFIMSGDVAPASLAVLSAGALIPFLCHNVFGIKSKMYIGDGGTLLMGTVMSAFVIKALDSDSLLAATVGKDFGMVAFTLAVLAIPVFDCLRVMVARIVRHSSPFHPDRTHLHHLFLDLGFSHVGTSLTVIILNLIIVALWWLSYKAGASIDMQLYIVIALGLLITFGMYAFLRHHERKQTGLYRALRRFGDATHIGHLHWWQGFRSFLDAGVEESGSDAEDDD